MGFRAIQAWYIFIRTPAIHCQDKRANDSRPGGAALVNYSTIRYHAYITREREK